jgi:GTP-binding protein
MAPKTAGSPAVVVVGRPNVGKSTLFNRITKTRRAIVTAVPGTTRDALALPVEWEGTVFQLIDTGGMFGASEDPLHQLVIEHGKHALERADLIVFVVDGREGPVPGDQEIAEAVRELGVPVIIAVNKTDDRRARDRALEFYQFGFEPVIEIAAEHGHGTGELLDEVVRRLRTGDKPSRSSAETVEASGRPREVAIAIVGRPNVGKSSLVNRLLREERVLVSDMPGTTRDAIDVVLKWHKRTFRIVDTAGIRRPGRVARTGQLESLSVLIAKRAIQRADVAVLVIDAVEGATEQDGAIAGEADKAGCGIVVAANKWDLVKSKGPDFAKQYDDELHRRLKFLEYAPVLHISARTGERTPKLLETIDRVGEARQQRVSTGQLNKFLEAVTAAHPPSSPGRKEVKILYAAQTGVAPPAFVFFTNVATKFHFSYERFLVNRLRETFGFEGTPIRIHVRRRGEGKGRRS